MKTNLEIPEELFREIKARAVLDGCKLNDFVTKALRLRMNQPSSHEKRTHVKFPLFKSRSKQTLQVPDDITSRLELAGDLERHKASMR
jgi:hypothetical protein